MMNYKEIANRVTGFGCPIFSVSWNPPKLEVDLARRIVAFLEDRRVLYNPYELEAPEHCKQSVIQIREFITKTLFDVRPDSELGVIIRTMRAACRKFLDDMERFAGPENYYRYKMSMGDQFIFDSGIGELRGAIGIQLAKLLVMYGIDCAGELLKILPCPLEE